MVKRDVFSAVDETFLRTEEATPIHNMDSCEFCGKCLACHGDKPCEMNEGGHGWMIYVDEPPQPFTGLDKDE